MIAHKVRANEGLAASNSLSNDIWKRLTILRTKAWFDVVVAIAKEHQVTAKLENQYSKSAIVYGIDGCRIGRIWQLDDDRPICYDLNNWRTQWEMANTITCAVEKIAGTND